MAFQLLCSQIFMQWTPLQRKRLLYISRTNRPDCLLKARNVSQDLHKMHSLFCKTIPNINLPSSGQIKTSESEKESSSSVGIILTINGRTEGAWKRQEEEEAVAQSAGSAQSWLLTMILGAQPPLDPSRFEPLIELLQQTRDFARLNLDLTNCLS